MILGVEWAPAWHGGLVAPSLWSFGFSSLRCCLVICISKKFLCAAGPETALAAPEARRRCTATPRCCHLFRIRRASNAKQPGTLHLYAMALQLLLKWTLVCLRVENCFCSDGMGVIWEWWGVWCSHRGGSWKSNSWSIFPVENKQPTSKAGYCWGGLPVTTWHRDGSQIPPQLWPASLVFPQTVMDRCIQRLTFHLALLIP